MLAKKQPKPNTNSRLLISKKAKISDNATGASAASVQYHNTAVQHMLHLACSVVDPEHADARLRKREEVHS